MEASEAEASGAVFRVGRRCHGQRAVAKKAAPYSMPRRGVSRAKALALTTCGGDRAEVVARHSAGAGGVSSRLRWQARGGRHLPEKRRHVGSHAVSRRQPGADDVGCGWRLARQRVGVLGGPAPPLAQPQQRVHQHPLWPVQRCTLRRRGGGMAVRGGRALGRRQAGREVGARGHQRRLKQHGLAGGKRSPRDAVHPEGWSEAHCKRWAAAGRCLELPA